MIWVKCKIMTMFSLNSLYIMYSINTFVVIIMRKWRNPIGKPVYRYIYIISKGDLTGYQDFNKIISKFKMAKLDQKKYFQFLELFFNIIDRHYKKKARGAFLIKEFAKKFINR